MLSRTPAVLAVLAAYAITLWAAISVLTDQHDSPEPTPKTSARDGSAQLAPEQVRVTVVSAILHPAALPSGQRRRRARLSVHIKVHNSGTKGVVLARPALLAARQHVRTRSRGGLLPARSTLDTTVRFETKGAVTDELRKEKRGRILVAEHSYPIAVKVGSPAHSAARAAVIQRAAWQEWQSDRRLLG